MASSPRQFRAALATGAVTTGIVVLFWAGLCRPNANPDTFPVHPDAGFHRGECTWYVFQRAQDFGWRIRFDHPYGRHARDWPERMVDANLSVQPVAGSVMVFDAWPGNPYGHAAYVETASPDGRQFEISHANFAVGASIGKRQGVEVYRAECELVEGGVRLEGAPRVYAIRGFFAPPRNQAGNAARIPPA